MSCSAELSMKNNYNLGARSKLAILMHHIETLSKKLLRIRTNLNECHSSLSLLWLISKKSLKTHITSILNF